MCVLDMAVVAAPKGVASPLCLEHRSLIARGGRTTAPSKPPIWLRSLPIHGRVLFASFRRQRHQERFAVSCMNSSSTSDGDAPPTTKLYVSGSVIQTHNHSTQRGLSFRTTEEGLKNAFERFGELVEVNLVMDRRANRPRGFAFLRYATAEESQKAIEGMHGTFLDGRVIFVEVSKPRSELPQRFSQAQKRC